MQIAVSQRWIRVCSVLFGKNKNSFLPGKADFPDLSVCAKENRGVLRLLLAVFPTPFAFRHDVLAFLAAAFIAVNGEPISARLQRGFPDFRALGEIDRL